MYNVKKTLYEKQRKKGRSCQVDRCFFSSVITIIPSNTKCGLSQQKQNSFSFELSIRFDSIRNCTHLYTIHAYRSLLSSILNHQGNRLRQQIGSDVCVFVYTVQFFLFFLVEKCKEIVLLSMSRR